MANITRFSPFDDFFGDLGRGFWMKPIALPADAELRMKVDVKEDEKTFTVSAEIPGVKKEDIQVDVEGNTVSLRAEVKREKEEKEGEKVVYSERAYGMASRSFTLPAEVDSKGARAEYKDGLLSLTLPKKSNGQSRHIPIS